MMNKPKPLPEELLRRFVAGELNEKENEKVMARLADDEASLEIVDALWNEQPSQTAVVQLPDIEPERAQRVRRRLIHKIHRLDLTKSVLTLGTQGFTNVAVSLLRPLLERKSRETHRNRRRRRGND